MHRWFTPVRKQDVPTHTFFQNPVETAFISACYAGAPARFIAFSHSRPSGKLDRDAEATREARCSHRMWRGVSPVRFMVEDYLKAVAHSRSVPLPLSLCPDKHGIQGQTVLARQEPEFRNPATPAGYGESVREGVCPSRTRSPGVYDTSAGLL